MASYTSATVTGSGESGGGQTVGSIFVGIRSGDGGYARKYATATLANTQQCLWIGAKALPK
jgi:hypothetical protein